MKLQWKYRYWLVGIILFGFSLLVMSGCSTHEDPWEHTEGDGPHVLVSFPPLYCFTKKVAGDHAKVLSLLTTMGPHDYNPSGRDAYKATGADVFLVNGLTLDDWVSRVANSSGNRKYRKDKDAFLVKMGNKLPPPKKGEEEGQDSPHLIKFSHHHHEGESHHHHHGEYDPHVWLGIEPAKFLVNEIKDKLSELAPQHKEVYAKNAKQYLKELDKLHKDGLEMLKDKKNRKLIATHDSLKYFARSFNLEVVDNIQPQAGVEASSQKLKELIDICEKENVRIITVEPQYSQATAETLQNQLQNKGVEVSLVEFDTLETVEPKQFAELGRDYYIVKMRENLKTLAKHLK